MAIQQGANLILAVCDHAPAEARQRRDEARALRCRADEVDREALALERLYEIAAEYAAATHHDQGAR